MGADIHVCVGLTRERTITVVRGGEAMTEERLKELKAQSLDFRQEPDYRADVSELVAEVERLRAKIHERLLRDASDAAWRGED